jgi:DNA invertase Pin-like site-specific DNA recombinase
LVNALEEFNSLAIDFVSLHEGVDTSSPNGRLFFGIFASIAQFERELIRDRVRSGLAAAKAKGKRIGRPRVVVDTSRIASLRRRGAPGPRSLGRPGSARARRKERRPRLEEGSWFRVCFPPRFGQRNFLAARSERVQGECNQHRKYKTNS